MFNKTRFGYELLKTTKQFVTLLMREYIRGHFGMGDVLLECRYRLPFRTVTMPDICQLRFFHPPVSFQCDRHVC